MSYLFKFYSEQYDRFMSFFELDKNSYILEVLGDVSKAKIVDIGGGTGVLANILINFGADVTVVDPEKNMTDIARARNSNINILNQYSNNISLEEESIDIIIMRDAFHHISNKDETLKECRRLLKYGGKILIYDFERKSFIGKLITIFEKSCFEKISMLSKYETKALCGNCFNDGKIVEISNYEFLYIGEKGR